MRRAPQRLGVALLLAVPLLAGRDARGAGPTNDDCLSCHGDAELVRGDGRKLDFSVEAFTKSVHGVAGASCTDCHADLATAELPHGDVVAPVVCATCHDAEGADYEKSAHSRSVTSRGGAKLPSKAARCVDCHGTHGILSSKDPESSTNHFKVPPTCIRCHGDPKVHETRPRESGVPTSFTDSIHGKALFGSGLKVAPNCATCHGHHDIRHPKDPDSTVSRAKVPETCGTCHTGILMQYKEGVHGKALQKGNDKAPVCITCHSAHEVKSAEQSAWKLGVLEECGTCHEQSLKTYRDTYHGQVTALGFTRIAGCADCHNAHAIFSKEDPRSTVSSTGRQKTCQRCHPGASANFAAYDPHADPHDRGRDRLLYFVGLCMRWLLIFVFSFFGVHTALWFPRSWKERRSARQRSMPRNGGGQA